MKPPRYKVTVGRVCTFASNGVELDSLIVDLVNRRGISPNDIKIEIVE